MKPVRPQLHPARLAPTKRSRCIKALACLIVLVVLAGCSQAREAIGGTRTLTSSDGALQFQVPSSWSARTDLNDSAALQAGDPEAEAYAVVIEDPRAPFQAFDLGRFADTQMQELVGAVELANLAEPRLVPVGDREAIQYQLTGVLNGVEVAYLYTFIETPDRFLRVVAWSLASNFTANRDELEAVAASVRQLQDLPAAPSPTEPAEPEAPAVAPQDPAEIQRGVDE